MLAISITAFVFFMDVIDTDKEQQSDTDSDIPVSDCVPDSSEYAREARGIWAPHVVAAARIVMKRWNKQAGIDSFVNEPPKTLDQRESVRLRSVPAERTHGVPGGNAAGAPETSQAPLPPRRTALVRDESSDE